MARRLTRVSFIVLALSFLGAGIARAGHEDMIRNMAAFNRSYLSSLVVTRTGDTGSSIKAVTDLLDKWEIFAKAFDSEDREVFVSQKAVSDVNRLIREGLDELTRNGNPAGAHEILEEIRESLIYLRRGNRLAYYFSALEEFRAQIEQVAAILGQKPSAIPDEGFERLRKSFAVAYTIWREFRQTSFPPELLSFDRDQEEAFTGRVWAISQDLSSLDEALKSRNARAAANAIKNVQAGFDGILQLSSSARPFITK